MNLQISENRRFICDESGQPFFYLADTAWELLHRLNREDTLFYLRDRAAKGYTVIQTVILAEEDGLRVPNANGDLPLHDLDPTRPSEAYFQHVDWVLEQAAILGLTLGQLPTWGDKWNLKWGQGPEVFTPENAFTYGKYLSERYKDTPNIIWILGGDRPFESDTHLAITEQMAAGIEAGGSQHLRTLHPVGGCTSSEHFADVPWLDFHMWQSGHGRNTPNYERIRSDYDHTPVKPVLDGEPGYEDHKAGFALENGFLDDYDCRKALYWALFSGACGHTYGCHPVWQFWEKGRRAVNHPRRDWREALALPGAAQMQFARTLHQRWPFLGGVPAQEMIAQQPEAPAFHIAALRAEDGRFALFYFPSNTQTEVRLDGLKGSQITAHWFDPRNGRIEASEKVEAINEIAIFTPPAWGPDWVLALETK